MRVTETVILASGARAATQTLGPYANPDADGAIHSLEVVLDLTAFTTAASLTLSIEEYNEGSGAFRQIVAAAALAANGVKRLRIGPEMPQVANVSETQIVGRQYRVVVTHGNANSHTYSVTIKRLYD